MCGLDRCSVDRKCRISLGRPSLNSHIYSVHDNPPVPSSKDVDVLNLVVVMIVRHGLGPWGESELRDLERCEAQFVLGCQR